MRYIPASCVAALLATMFSTGVPADAPAQIQLTRVIHVDDSAAPGGNGGTRFPYQNLPEALATARTVSGRVIVDVAPGRYVIDSTLVIDRSLVLRGSTILIKDADGFPRNATEPGTAVRIEASANLGSEPLIFVGRDDGTVIRRVTIRGLVLKHADDFATEITIRRVQDFAVLDNIFRATTRFGLETVASSGRVVGNHFSACRPGRSSPPDTALPRRT